SSAATPPPPPATAAKTNQAKEQPPGRRLAASLARGDSTARWLTRPLKPERAQAVDPLHARMAPAAPGLDSMDKVRPGKWQPAHAAGPYTPAPPPPQAAPPT